MQFKIDYHFHPNLPRSEKKALEKCENWWKEFESKGINTVVVTEHVFKNPEKAFRLIEQAKPENSFVFPGMEYLTREGVDIIIFSDNTKFYSFKELRPYTLTCEEIVDFIIKKKLKGVIVHPHSLTLSSIIRVKGKAEYTRHINKLNSVEVTNSGYMQLYLLLNTRFLRRFFAKKNERIAKTRRLPMKDYPKKIKLLTAGSDAHVLGELGTSVVIEATPSTLFEKMSSNKNPKIVERTWDRIEYWCLVKQALCALEEFLIKKRLKISL